MDPVRSVLLKNSPEPVPTSSVLNLPGRGATDGNRTCRAGVCRIVVASLLLRDGNPIGSRSIKQCPGRDVIGPVGIWREVDTAVLTYATVVV